MATDPEMQAARLFEEYSRACLEGPMPDLEAYVSRCPKAARDAFRNAAAGIAFVHANYEPALARREVVKEATARIAKLGARRQRLAQAQARAAHRNAGRPIRDAVGFLSQVIGVSLPKLGVSPRPQPAAMYRGAARAPGSRAVDRLRREARRARAEEAAESLLARMAVDRLPVDPFRIAAALGVLVIEEAVEDCDGALVVEGDAAGILINSAVEPEGRRRFTLAHEVGHLILHEDRFRYRVDRLRDIENQATDDMDQEASYFAAALMMPLSLISPQYTRAEPSLELADELADQCGVSTQAAARRLVTASDHPCLLIVLDEGRVVWADRSSSWTGAFVDAGRTPPPGSAAASVLQGAPGDEDEVALLMSEWSTGSAPGDDREAYEEARCTGEGRALVILTHTE